MLFVDLQSHPQRGKPPLTQSNCGYPGGIGNCCRKDSFSFFKNEVEGKGRKQGLYLFSRD